MSTEPGSARHCRTCGAPVPAQQPCAACALSQVLFEDAFPARDSENVTPAPIDDVAPMDTGFDATALPCRLGPYVVRREIAVGGSGAVYEAEDTRTRRIVALKLFRSVFLVGDSDKARFRLEAETAARLDHPHIVPVFEVGEHRRQPFISMKLMEGGSLAQRIAKPGPRISDRDAAGLVSTIARAVQHAHQHGVLHRDLKPANVLFDGSGVPFLTDFGLAKLMNEDSSLTMSSAHLGTPHHMSPEQAAGRVRDISTASDIWALGTILYQLTTGQLPFSGESQEDIFRRILDVDPVPPSQVRALQTTRPGDSTPSIHESSRSAFRDLETLCLRCLDKDPARRPASAGGLADELDRWLRGEPIHSRAVTPLERAGKWVRRNKKISLLAAFLLLTLVSGAGVSTVLWRRAETARRHADQNALLAHAAEVRARDHAYFATVAQAFSARAQGDLGHTRHLLAGMDPERRGFEWRLLDWLCRGDDAGSLNLAPREPRCVAWDSIRKNLAVLTSDRVIRWFDPVTLAVTVGPTVPNVRAQHTQIAVDTGFQVLTFSPDGKRFLCGDGDILIVAETATGALIHSTAGRHMGGVWIDDERVLFAGNNVWGAAGTASSGIFNITTRATERILDGIFGPVVLSPDREWLAWSRDNPRGMQIEVLPRTNLVPVATLQSSPAKRIIPIHGSPALLAFSADRHYLAVAIGHQARTASDVSVYDLNTQAPVLEASLPAQIHALAFSPDQPVLAVASGDSSLRTFRIGTASIASPTYDDEAAPGLGQPIGEAGPQTPPTDLLSRSAGGGQFGFLLGNTERIRDLTFSPGVPGTAPLATVGDDGSLRLWPLIASAPQARVGGISTANFWEHPAASANGRFALYRADTNRTWLWDRTSGRRIPYPEWHYPLAVLSDGRAVTRHFETGELFVWSPITNANSPPHELWRVKGIPSHPGFGVVVRGILSSDERTLVGLIPGKLLVLNLESHTTSGTDDQRMLYGASGVNAVDLSPDGRRIAVTGFIGHHARLYRADAITGGFVSLGTAEDYDTAVAFHPDGRRLFVGNEDGWVRVFDANNGQELESERWRAQTGGVTALAVSQDGRIVTSSGDRTLQFWDALPAPGGERHLRLRVSPIAPRNWIRFAANDTVLLHSAPGHALEAWEAPTRPQ